jgi:hypothetical protein
MVISYRSFGTTCRSRLQGSGFLFIFSIFLDSWALKMVSTGCPETSLRNHHHSLHNNPVERSSRLLRGGGLKSHEAEAVPLQAWTGPEGCRRLRLPEFMDSRNKKVARLSVLRTGRLYPPGNIAGTHFCYKLNRPQGHSAAGRVMSIKNSSYTVGNRTCDLPTCSAVPQQTAPPSACPQEYLR